MIEKNRIEYGQWLGMVLGWIFVTNFFSWAMLVNMDYFLTLSELHHVAEENLMVKYMYSNLQYFEASMFGILFGTAFFFINAYTDRKNLVKKSFGKVIIIKTLLYCAAIALSFMLIYFIYIIFDVLPPEADLAAYAQEVSFEFALMIAVYFVSMIILTNIFLQITRKFGPGNFLRLLSGKYYQPSEEEKIFLFIDLKNSTGIAESLGHKKYSQLLRDCFHDITEVVLRYRAEVYQYVGDEVVLSWNVKDGINELRCLKTLGAYRNKLESKREYYTREYGVFPEFKGGMDLGLVTVTEIGDLKRDIAYHGDVLNTAARIQEQCNSFDKVLLFSEHIFDRIKSKNGFDYEKIGQIALRGKSEQLDIYSLV